MKLSLVLLITAATVFTAKADDDKPISFEALPKASKVFIQTYFNGQEISYAKMESEFFDKSYEVFFVDGKKIEFDKKGAWETVDCRSAAVPAGVVPARLEEFVKKNHAGLFITKIDRDKYDYEIELNNGIEIKFDLKFNLMGYDD